MPREEDTLIAEALVFLDEVTGNGIPIQNIMRTGKFPDGWPARYLDFVARVSVQYGESLPLPREILAVIYTASVYCTKRYFDWQRHTGGADSDAEQVINTVRWAGDQLVMAQFWRPSKPQSGSVA